MSIHIDIATGPPLPALSGTSIPTRTGPNAMTFAFALPGGVPAGTLLELTPVVDDPSCAESAGSSVLWDPRLLTDISVFMTIGESQLLASSDGIYLPQGDIIRWVTTREFKDDITRVQQLFNFTSTTSFDALTWQASLQPFSGTFDPLDPEPPGLLATGLTSCTVDCTYAVDFSTFIPQAPATEQTRVEWSSRTMGPLIEPIALFTVATGYTAHKGRTGPPSAPAPSSVTAVYDSASQSRVSVLPAFSVPPITFYFRALPMKNGQILGPASNTVILRWLGPYDGPDLANSEVLDCEQTPDHFACVAWESQVPNYTVAIASYHGFIAAVEGHWSCFIVTETTTVKYAVGSIASFDFTFNAGDRLCPPKPKEPSFFEAIVNFVVDAVNWVASTYKDLKDGVISFVSNFVPAALCNKSCLGALLDVGLVALGIPPSLPNFDQIMNEGLDYLAASVVEEIGIPKEIQDLAAGPAKDLAIEEFKKAAEAEIKKGVAAGIAEMQRSLAAEVSWIPNEVPIKPDPLGSYQPPMVTLLVTRKPNAKGTCSSLAIESTVTNSTPFGVEELNGAKNARLYETEYIPLPRLDKGESILIPVILKPRISFGFPGAKYSSSGAASSGWSSLYSGGIATLKAGYEPCVEGTTLTVPTQANLVGLSVTP
ncbi:MAG: hypothetical protein KC479_12645 [Dehalococcoidia bacterium]|nr:hypothetical protein [Dehalococcoidia bacterium]